MSFIYDPFGDFNQTESILNTVLLHYYALRGIVACNMVHHVMGDDSIVPLDADCLSVRESEESKHVFRSKEELS